MSENSQNLPHAGEYRRDGWPLCPRCGNDELASTHPITNKRDEYGNVVGFLTRRPEPTDPMRCYVCGWEGEVPARV